MIIISTNKTTSKISRLESKFKSDDKSYSFKSIRLTRTTTSKTLIELSLFRNDIYSYRPNARINFFGNRIGSTKKIENLNSLKEIFIKYKIKNNNKNFKKKFTGSKKKICTFISKIKENYC